MGVYVAEVSAVYLGLGTAWSLRERLDVAFSCQPDLEPIGRSSWDFYTRAFVCYCSTRGRMWRESSAWTVRSDSSSCSGCISSTLFAFVAAKLYIGCKYCWIKIVKSIRGRIISLRLVRTFTDGGLAGIWIVLLGAYCANLSKMFFRMFEFGYVFRVNSEFCFEIFSYIERIERQLCVVNFVRISVCTVVEVYE